MFLHRTLASGLRPREGGARVSSIRTATRWLINGQCVVMELGVKYVYQTCIWFKCLSVIELKFVGPGMRALWYLCLCVFVCLFACLFVSLFLSVSQ